MNPKLVGQMAGAKEVLDGIERRPGTSYAELAEQLGKELPGQVYKAGNFEPVAG